MRERNIDKIKENDLISNKILTVFIASFAGIGLLMLLQRNINRASTFMAAYTALRVSVFIAAAVALSGLVLMLLHRGHPEKERRVFSGINILCYGLFAEACVLFILFYNYLESIKALYAIIPAAAVIYLVYHIYTREFFCHLVICCASAFGMWVFSRMLVGRYSGYAPAALAACSAALLLVGAVFYMLQKNKGRFGRDKSRRPALPQGTMYGLLYLTCALMIAMFAAAFIMGAGIAYYLVFGILGYLLVLAIFFTTQLI